MTTKEWAKEYPEIAASLFRCSVEDLDSIFENSPESNDSTDIGYLTKADVDTLCEITNFMSEYPAEANAIHCRIARAEAIKEFAERVKSMNGNHFLESRFESPSLVNVSFDQKKFGNHIDDLVKEFLEGK